MLNDKNKNLYQINKVTDFEQKNEMHELKKQDIIRRVNSRLEKFIENKQKNNIDINSDDCLQYIKKQIKKMDVEEVTKKRKSVNDIFKTAWGEDIYRNNAFLGAEANKMSEHSKINRKLESYIHNREKINRKPSEQEVENIMHKFISQMDKKDMNDAQVLRRKSIPHILKAIIYHSEPVVIPFQKNGNDHTTILFKLDVSTLSYSEVKELKNIFIYENDPIGNTLIIEIGIVEDSVDSEETRHAQEACTKDVCNMVVEKLKEKTKYDKEEVDKIISEIDEIDKMLKENAQKIKQEKIEEKKKLKKKLVKNNLIMVSVFILMSGLLAIHLVN